VNKTISDRKAGRILMQVLWPAFLISIVAEGIFFSMIDPQELEIVGMYLANSREAAYTIGFFVFWALLTLSSGLTYMLAHGSAPAPEALRPPEDHEHRHKDLIGR